MEPIDEASLNFRAFYDSSNEKKYEDYAQRPETKVADEISFSEMRDYVQHLYNGVEVAHSFVDSNEQIFDCIPFEDQPSLRGASASIPTPKDLNSVPTTSNHTPGIPVIQLHPERKDKFGNLMSCPPGTVALRRITLDELSKNETLNFFFERLRLGKGGIRG